MKNKIMKHPRLFIDVDRSRRPIEYKYLSNHFNDSGDRIVKSVSSNDIDVIDIVSSNDDLLFNLNKLEFQKLEVFLLRQSKVVDRMASKKPDIYKTVKDSYELLLLFKSDFKKWFGDHGDL